MTKQEVLEKLKIDEHYYGDFGKQYLSNSDIMALLNNPLALGQQSKPSAAFLVGGYFHTAILEPNKLNKYKIVKSTTRNTKAYKDVAGGELCLLQHEVDSIELMRDKLMSNDVCKSLITGNVEYEQPNIVELEGQMWKGKADILNHDEKLIIDLKTTADLSKFKSSAYRYNYDSQAYIYQELFGLPLEFYVIDKSTYQLAIFKPTEEFIQRGKEKVENAVFIYNTYFSKDSEENINQFVLHETL